MMIFGRRYRHCFAAEWPPRSTANRCPYRFVRPCFDESWPSFDLYEPRVVRGSHDPRRQARRDYSFQPDEARGTRPNELNARGR